MIDLLHQKPLLGRQINWAHPLTKRLKLFVPINEGSGRWATDVVSKTPGVFDANMTESAWIPGRDGYALDFDGTDDRIDYANIWNPTDQAQTIAFWIYPDSVSVDQYFLALHASGDGGLAYIFWHGSADIVAFTVITSGEDLRQLANAGQLTTGSWQYLCVTWDGSKIATNVHIYINGSEVSYVTTANGTGTSVSATGSHSIGGRIFDDARNYNGRMANLGWWNRILTLDEINTLPRESYAMFQQNRVRWFTTVAPPVGDNVPNILMHLAKMRRAS